MALYHNSNDKSMTQSPHPWIPPTWNTSGSIATYVIRSLPEGISASIETACDDDFQIRSWLAKWWEGRLDGFRQRSAKYSDSQSTFLYAVVAPVDEHRDACDPDNLTVREFAEGTYPNSPGQWPERELVELVEFAISDLSR